MFTIYVQCDAIRWESFCGDVALDSFNMAYRDEASNLDQKYEKQISLNLFNEDFKFLK